MGYAGRSKIMQVVLDRFRPDGTVGDRPTRVDYDVPESVYQTGGSPKAGATVLIETDGHKITLIERR